MPLNAGFAIAMDETRRHRALVVGIA